jgi:RNAse (barnase) inhibitor barstar
MTDAPDYPALLQDAGRAGVYHLPLTGREEIVAAATACDYAVFRVNLDSVEDKAGLLEALARDLAFPDWFGRNWDALADCLADFSWRPAEGYLVLLEHCDLLHARAPDDHLMALQLFAAAADEWREQGVALWCLVDMHADGLSWLPNL